MDRTAAPSKLCARGVTSDAVSVSPACRGLPSHYHVVNEQAKEAMRAVTAAGAPPVAISGIGAGANDVGASISSPNDLGVQTSSLHDL